MPAAATATTPSDSTLMRQTGKPPWISPPLRGGSDLL